MAFQDLFEPLHVVRRQQCLHLSDGDAVECGESLCLRQSLANEDGVEAFEVRKHDQLLKRGVVADVALGIGMSITPLLGGLAEEGDIQQVGLAGIDDGGLRLGNGGRNERFLDRIGVDAVVDLREGALEVPIELQAVVFVVLEPLKFFDEVELELHRDPGGKLEGNVLVRVGASVTPGAGADTHGSGFLNPLLRGEDEAVQARLHPNPVEFDGIKIRVVEPFPDAQELHGVAIAEPIADHIIGMVGVLKFGNVSQADDVLLVLRQHGDGCSLDFNSASLGFVHS